MRLKVLVSTEVCHRLYLMPVNRYRAMWGALLGKADAAVGSLEALLRSRSGTPKP